VAIAEAISRQIEDEEKDENGGPVLTYNYLKKMCRTNTNLYYSTVELNDQLYLHRKGFKII